LLDEGFATFFFLNLWIQVKKIKTYIGITLFLLTVLLIGQEGNITDFGWRLNLLTGTCFAALFYLNYYPSDADMSLKIRLMIHNVLFLILLIICPAVSRLPLLVFSTFIFYIILNNKNQNNPEMVILALSALIFFLYQMMYHYSSGLWYLIQTGSQAISKLTSSIIQQPVNSNPSYTGIQISMFFILCTGCIVWFIKSKRFWLLAVGLIYITVMTIIYVIFQFYFPRWIMLTNHSFYVHSLQGQLILFILLLPLICYLFSKVDNKRIIKQKGSISKKQLIKIPFWLMIFLSFFILTFRSSLELEKKNVLFYDNGYLDWRLPDHKNYGARNGGMFGMLPIYLKANNYLVKHDTTINTGNLDDINILVIVNLLQEFSDDEKHLIWNFVDNGGALFVLGDHTGFKKIREPTNELLQPFNIELNFDCAIPFRDSWRNSMKYFPHFITSSVSSNYESNIFIGASLSIGPRVRPLIIGKYGFSDPGDINAGHNGYLGDMRYLQGEQLGDQVLVTETHYGKGKVLVFGDTSPFQNSALVQSHTFVDKVFRWLSIPWNWWSSHGSLISLILLILASVVLLWLKINLYDLIIITASICLAIFINNISFLKKSDIDQLKSVGKELAIIDASHLERFSLSQWEGNGYGGLCYNLMRAGYMPLINTTGISEIVAESRIVVFVAPAKPFRNSDIRILDDYVRNGGFILIASGWEESNGSSNLLNNFGLQVENIPLGKIDPNQNSKMISFTKAWALNSADTKYDVLCEVWDQPTIIFKPVGKGGIFLVGDSGFLLNDNLEGMETYNSHNILFLKEIIEKYVYDK